MAPTSVSSSVGTAGVFARPLTLETAADITRFSELIDQICAHRPWFSDEEWHDPTVRRQHAVHQLSTFATTGRIWEVWQGATMTGIIALSDIHLGRDAYGHFLFFDQTLANKQTLCLNVLAKAFAEYKLQIIRLQIPTYAHVLAKWARKRLWFRYEAETRHLDWPKRADPLDERTACLGSRLYRALRYEGRWHDVLLLSLTREEFHTQYGKCIPAVHEAERHQHGADAGADAGDRGSAAAVPERSAERSEPVPADEQSPASDGQHV